jgi:hypothetical protein
VRTRALVVSGLVLLALTALIFSAGTVHESPPRGSAPVPPPGAASNAPPQPPATPSRNVFEFAPDPALRTAPERSRPVPEEPPLVAPAPPEPAAPVRLVGFVRRSGGLKAALAIHGSVYVLGEGEGAEGYVLVGVDEDDGVRITAPDESILVLPPPS